MRLPSSFTLPLPTAMTLPCCGFSLARVGDDDPADLLFAFLDALNNDAVVQRSDVHAVYSVCRKVGDALRMILKTPASLAVSTRHERLLIIWQRLAVSRRRLPTRSAGARPVRLSARRLILMLAHLAGQRVAVDAEGVGGLGEAAVAAAEDAGDEALLELAHGVLEVDAPVDHLLDELLEPVADHERSPDPRPGQAAERLEVLLARPCHDVVGQRRHRRLLVPADPLEVVADELLVEARLRAARRVAVARPEARRVGRQRLVDQDDATRPGRVGSRPNSNLVSATMMPQRLGVRRRFGVQAQRQVADAGEHARPTSSRGLVSLMLMSWPLSALVAGVKIGSGSRSDSRRPGGSAMPQTSPVAE